jgi:hypothetical protein
MTLEQVPAVEPVFFPRGVADPAAQAGYVADGAGIVAVGLQEGRTLWRTDRADQPLISDGDRLAAASLRQRLSNVLKVVVLDPSHPGGAVVVSDPVRFPDWVTVATERRDSFRMRARTEGTRLRLEWEAHARYGGGAPPPTHPRREAERDAAGVVEVDLQSGAVAPLPLERDSNSRTAIGRPPLDADDLAEPWLAGTTVARLLWDVGGDEQILLLETSDRSTGETGAVLELVRGQGLVVQVTPDGCHLFVHEEPARPGRDEWWVYSVQTGQRVATLTHERGGRYPVILGERVFYLVEPLGGATPGRVLRARELLSDTLVWELSLAGPRKSAVPRRRP